MLLCGGILADPAGNTARAIKKDRARDNEAETKKNSQKDMVVMELSPCEERFFAAALSGGKQNSRQHKENVRTLESFVERSNSSHIELYAETNSDKKNLYIEETRMCVEGFREIVTALDSRDSKRNVLNSRVKLMCLRLIQRWFECIARLDQWVKRLRHSHADIFADAELSPDKKSTLLRMGGATSRLIAGTCLMITTKYLSDYSSIGPFDKNDAVYRRVAELQTSKPVDPFMAFVFYHRKVREIVGLPTDLVAAREQRNPSASVRDDKTGDLKRSAILQHKRDVLRIERQILSDLDWRIADPMELEFVELFTAIAMFYVDKLQQSFRAPRVGFEVMRLNVLYMSEHLVMLTVFNEVVAEEAPACPSWLWALACVLCILKKLMARDRPMYRRVSTALKRHCNFAHHEEIKAISDFVGVEILAKNRRHIVRSCIVRAERDKKKVPLAAVVAVP